MAKRIPIFFLSCLPLFLLACTSSRAPMQFEHGMWVKPISNGLAPKPGGPLRFSSFPFASPQMKGSPQKIAQSASQFVQKANGKKNPGYRKDCSGLTRAIFQNAGTPLGGSAVYTGENDVSVLYRYAQRNGKLHRHAPHPGDLVFFDNTLDLNRDGEQNDLLTHIGVVESIQEDGTVVFVHQLGPRPVRARMNLRHPQLSQSPKTGKRLNHILRRGKKGEKSKTAGSLFAGFATMTL